MIRGTLKASNVCCTFMGTIVCYFCALMNHYLYCDQLLPAAIGKTRQVVRLQQALDFDR